MVSQLDALVNQEIDGYLIEKSLGAGGMARVYRARDVRLDRYVAIKVIQPHVRDDETYTSRFVKEARAVAALQHSNIVSIYRFGEVDGLYYMAMQYIEGADLAWVLNEYVADNELMSLEEVYTTLNQVSSALDYAHSQGVIHRDVKPANIMLDQSGKAYLMDFGLALKQIEGTHGEIFGTPHYVAPEQAISSAGVVPQSDQYSLGVMLYEMLTGSVPFDAPSAMEIAMAHMSDPLPSPLERNPDLSPALVAILERVLQKEPGDRYPSCAALMADLEKAIHVPQTPSTRSSRISLVSIPDQVQVFREANPLLVLPPVPAPVSEQIAAPTAPAPAASPTKKISDKSRPIAELTVKASPPVTRPSTAQNQTWTIVGVASFIIILVGIGAVFAILNARNNAVLPPTSEAGGSSSDTATTTVPPAEILMVASETPTPTLTVTDAPTFTLVQPTISPSATITDTPLPPSPQPSPTEAPTIALIQEWRLLLLANGEDTLYIINVSDPSAPEFRLRQLDVTGERRGGVSGNEWGVNRLRTNQCVRLQKNKNAKSPRTNCDLVGDSISVGGSERFWKPEFNMVSLSYRDSWSASCSVALVQSSGCQVTIPFSAEADG